MIVLGSVALALALTGPAPAQIPAFPQPIVVERQVRQSDGTGGAPYETPRVKEHYFGNHMAVVRADGTRALVDFERRDYTEVDPKGGTYWSLSFSRLGELRNRLREAESQAGTRRKQGAETTARVPIRIQELSTGSGSKARVNVRGTRRLRASVEGTAGWAEAWYDETIPFGEKAIAAIESFETALAGSAKDDPSRTSELVSALRAAGKGAFVVRFERPLAVKDGRAVGMSEDIVLDWKRLEKAPVDLLRIPENLKRVPSPLETLVVFAEEEAELRSRGRK